MFYIQYKPREYNLYIFKLWIFISSQHSIWKKERMQEISALNKWEWYGLWKFDFTHTDLVFSAGSYGLEPVLK